MYQSLMVPLDRSPFAEQALPWAINIARLARACLDLVEVHSLYALEDPHAGWAPFDADRDTERRQHEQLYLDATAKWITSMAPVSVTTHVLMGAVVIAATIADSILERACALRPDLIVMATHGRHQAQATVRTGSVADELVRRASIPLLLAPGVEGSHEIRAEPAIDNILIPLDGSTLAEHVLEPAADLASLMDARCQLLRVIEFRSRMIDRETSDPPRCGETEEAEMYLKSVAERLRMRGLQIQTHVVVARHAATAILQEASAQRSSLIALATHGRGGLTRLWFGSVADKLIRHAASPILVYRPSATGTVPSRQRSFSLRG